jgi:hypothetical protein
VALIQLAPEIQISKTIILLLVHYVVSEPTMAMPRVVAEHVAI